jgi:hypothetical protein
MAAPEDTLVLGGGSTYVVTIDFSVERLCPRALKERLARPPLQNVDRHCAAFASATKFLKGQIMQIDTVGQPVAPEELGFFRLSTVAPILAILLIAATITAAITAFVGAQLATVA